MKHLPSIKHISLFVFLAFFSSSIFSQLTVAEYTIKNIKENSIYSDYGASYFGANRVFFSSNREDASSMKSRFNRRKGESNTAKYDLFKAFVNNKGELNYAERVLNNSKTKYNESNVSFSPDLRYVYFTQNNISKDEKYVKDDSDWVNLKIYRAKVSTNGDWVNIKSLPFNADNYSCAHPSISEDGKILFFTSDMPGTYGGSDIFWVQIFENGTYGEPQNIGANINSEFRETFPYVDGDLLYFSSDRTGSQGGLDVFMISLNDPQAIPQNIGSPVNSAFDDFCFVIDRQNKRGFFSSNRPKGKGQDDIYSFIQKTKIEQCKQIITGIVRDKKTNAIIKGAVVKIFSHKNIRLGAIPVKSDGKYRFDLACRNNYQIRASSKGYLPISKEVIYKNGHFSQEIPLYLEKVAEETKKEVKEEVVVVKEKIEKVKEEEKKELVEEDEIDVLEDFVYKNGKEMLNLPPIYFDLDQYYITKRAEKTLGKAILILERHPDIIIEFGAYTDCRSSDSYNLHLSNLRAKAVIDYIRNNSNISSKRIFGRGYGESKPVNHCIDGVKCSESEHLLNRRTEFVIINK